jgi:hypothetical protein
MIGQRKVIVVGGVILLIIGVSASLFLNTVERLGVEQIDGTGRDTMFEAGVTTKPISDDSTPPSLPEPTLPEPIVSEPLPTEPEPEPSPLPTPIPEKPTQKGCYRGGCSGQLCTDRADVITTCEFRAEYACYTTATCERQVDGMCGWTLTEEVRACLKNPGSI